MYSNKYNILLLSLFYNNQLKKLKVHMLCFVSMFINIKCQYIDILERKK